MGKTHIGEILGLHTPKTNNMERFPQGVFKQQCKQNQKELKMDSLFRRILGQKHVAIKKLASHVRMSVVMVLDAF